MASADTGLDFGRVVNVMVPDDRRAAIAQRLEEHPAIERVAVASRPPLTGELRTIRVVPSRSGSGTARRDGGIHRWPRLGTFHCCKST